MPNPKLTLKQVGNITLEVLLLFGAGLLAGGVNALAGGGSFIVFPALLLVGVPPVVANATNTFASLPGYVSGAIGFWRDILQYRAKLLPYSIAALVGGYLGAELLLQVSDAQFSTVVPWLMGIAVILFAFGGRFNLWVAARAAGRKNMALAGALALLGLLVLVNLYGGFFNGGHGILLLAFFALAGLNNIHAMNGLKLLLSAIVASVAVTRFAFAGSIAWYEGTSAFAGTLIGGYVAARLAHRVPTHILRIGVVIYGSFLTAIFFWKAYA